MDTHAAPPTAAPVLREPGALPERWQAMAGALAECERDGPIAGFLCGERVRLRYCEGQWGQIAQCPAAHRNEYGG